MNSSAAAFSGTVRNMSRRPDAPSIPASIPPWPGSVGRACCLQAEIRTEAGEQDMGPTITYRKKPAVSPVPPNDTAPRKTRGPGSALSCPKASAKTAQSPRPGGEKRRAGPGRTSRQSWGREGPGKTEKGGLPGGAFSRNRPFRSRRAWAWIWETRDSLTSRTWATSFIVRSS